MPIDKIRLAVIRERDRQGLTTAQLARLVEKDMHYSSVYKYLNGKMHLNTRKVSVILDVLDLKVQKVGRPDRPDP